MSCNAPLHNVQARSINSSLGLLSVLSSYLLILFTTPPAFIVAGLCFGLCSSLAACVCILSTISQDSHEKDNYQDDYIKTIGHTLFSYDR